MRRILFIIAGAVVLIGILVAVYFVFFTGNATLTVAPTGSTSTTLPTAGNVPTSNTGGTQSSNTPTPVTTSVTPRLVEIDQGPVVPGVFVGDVSTTTLVGTTTVVSTDVHIGYIERQSGNVFSYQVSTNQPTRTSNRTIPGIERAYWSTSGTTAFVQYLSGADNSIVNTYALPADGSNGFFLPQSLAGLAVSSTTLLTLASGTNGSIATSENLDGSKPSQVFSSALSSLRVALGGKSVFAFTRPSGLLAGYAFAASGGNLSRIEGPLNGLVALPGPLGKHMLVSYVVGGSLKMELIDLIAHTALQLPVATIVDKCAWSTDETAIYCGIPVNPTSSYIYPDDWYQGAAHFSDRIWKIDVVGRYASLVLDFSSISKQSLDIDSIAVDGAKTEVVFRNKVDGALWRYQL